MLSVNWCSIVLQFLYTRFAYQRHILLYLTSSYSVGTNTLKRDLPYNMYCINKWNESSLLTSHLWSCSGRATGTLWRALKCFCLAGAVPVPGDASLIFIAYLRCSQTNASRRLAAFQSNSSSVQAAISSWVIMITLLVFFHFSSI